VTSQIRISLVVAVAAVVFGLASAQAAPATTATGSPKPRQQPTLLWRTFPLEQRPTKRDEVTITRALRIIDESATASAPRDARSPAGVLLLLAAGLRLGLAALPETAFQDAGVTAFAERWRRELLVVGGAMLLTGVALMFS
jgi:hypothetical protein